MVIVALMLGGMLVSLSTSRDIASEKDTQKQLASINEALLGFAAAQGRLPCPATATSTGRESFCTNASGACGAELFIEVHGRCTDFFNGFFPSATLGLSPTDSQGFAIDAWSNRLRYVVSNKTAGSIDFPFTKPSGIKTGWATDPSQIQSDLFVCNTATNIAFAGAANADCPAADQLTNSAVAVVFSTGRNGGAAPTGADELANWTTSNDRVFVNATPSAAFDDLVTWLSPNILYNRLISAGRLP
jgi:type II secretory pathway pseudopilin PulG